MGSVMADFVSVASMFIGLATLTVLVRNAGTVNVINAASTGFSNVLNTAMGGNTSSVGNLTAPISVS